MHYRNIEKVLVSFYSQDDNLVFCNNKNRLLEKIDISEYTLSDCRLYIDISKKCLVSRNTIETGSIGISTKIKEAYKTISVVLKKLSMTNKRMICVDLKIVHFLSGPQRHQSERSIMEKRNCHYRDTLLKG